MTVITEGLADLIVRVAALAGEEGIGYVEAAERLVEVDALSREDVVVAVQRYVAQRAQSRLNGSHAVSPIFGRQVEEAYNRLEGVVFHLADRLAQKYMGVDGRLKRADEMEKPDREFRLRMETAVEEGARQRRVFWEKANQACDERGAAKIADLPMDVQFELARLI
jgi:hypothetical protein